MQSKRHEVIGPYGGPAQRATEPGKLGMREGRKLSLRRIAKGCFLVLIGWKPQVRPDLSLRASVWDASMDQANLFLKTFFAKGPCGILTPPLATCCLAERQSLPLPNQPLQKWEMFTDPEEHHMGEGCYKRQQV